MNSINYKPPNACNVCTPAHQVAFVPPLNPCVVKKTKIVSVLETADKEGKFLILSRCFGKNGSPEWLDQTCFLIVAMNVIDTNGHVSAWTHGRLTDVV